MIQDLFPDLVTELVIDVRDDDLGSMQDCRA
jgi:hypothetical protein